MTQRSWRPRQATTARSLLASALALLFAAASQDPRTASPAEIRQAEADVPRLVEVLELEPGMTVADVGAGFGAMSMVLARWLGPSGRVYATDIAPAQLSVLREMTAREHLDNVTVIEGSDRSANLPDACCDAIFMRDVYHHFTHPGDINRSLSAALGPGGRLAIIDFEPKPGSKLPEGVASNRGGHGIPPAIVVQEVNASGLTYVKTIAQWPPDSNPGEYFLVLFRR